MVDEGAVEVRLDRRDDDLAPRELATVRDGPIEHEVGHGVHALPILRVRLRWIVALVGGTRLGKRICVIMGIPPPHVLGRLIRHASAIEDADHPAGMLKEVGDEARDGCAVDERRLRSRAQV